jgi:hypothetical protein
MPMIRVTLAGFYATAFSLERVAWFEQKYELDVLGERLFLRAAIGWTLLARRSMAELLGFIESNQ